MLTEIIDYNFDILRKGIHNMFELKGKDKNKEIEPATTKYLLSYKK